MKIEIDLPEMFEEAIEDNLRLPDDHPANGVPLTKVRLAFMKAYINEAINRQDIDLHVCQWLDDIESSGEMEDVLYEITLAEM